MFYLFKNLLSILFELFDDLDYQARLDTVRTGDDHTPVHSLHKVE